MKIMAIDPGSTESAYAFWDCEKHDFVQVEYFPSKGILKNEQILTLIDFNAKKVDLMAIEMIQAYGYAVGRSIFETILWIGVFCERSPIETRLYTRTMIKSALGGCKTDADVRQAIRQRYGEARKGEKLEGVKTDIWQALGLAIALEENPNLKDWNQK